MIYSRELKERTLKAFEEDMAAGILRKPELEEKILAYYRKTTPSLQEFYSRYTSEWDAFYSCLHLPIPAFVEYLRQMRGAFRKRYALSELNIEYYIRNLADAWEYQAEGDVLKEMFLDKWYALLNRKEYDYQYQHIHRLCDDFYLIQRKQGHQADNKPYHSRIEWLLHTRPELNKGLLVYERTMKNHPAIRQLVQLLGKRSKHNLKYDAASGINKQLLVSHASTSDITGITQGDNLNSLLPSNTAIWRTMFCVLSSMNVLPRNACKCSITNPSKRQAIKELPNESADKVLSLCVWILREVCKENASVWPNRSSLPLPS